MDSTNARQIVLAVITALEREGYVLPLTTGELDRIVKKVTEQADSLLIPA